MTTAIYPGSFDPVTNGHVDIAARASALFEHVIVGVYDRPLKSLLFSTSERLSMAREALKHLPNVEVQSYDGLTVNFARNVGAGVIVGAGVVVIGSVAVMGVAVGATVGIGVGGLRW